MPVLSWWAICAVLTRASTTLTVLSIFVVGIWLNIHGLTTVGEIVTFTSFAGMLIVRLEQAVGFANRLFQDRAAAHRILRGRRHGAGGARPPGRHRSRPRARPDRIRRRVVLLRRQARRGRRPEIHRAAGRDHRAGRPDRRGQVDGAGAPAPRVRSAIGLGQDRRHGHPRAEARGAAPEHRRGVPGGAAVQPLDRREPARRPAGGDRRGDARGRRAGAGAGFHRAPIRRASRPASASAGACSRAASASASRSRARW